MSTFFLIIIILTLLIFSTTADDDYSPEEAVKLFPFSHRHPLKISPSTDRPKMTLATLKLDPDRVYSIMNLDHEKLSHHDTDNVTLTSRDFHPSQIFQVNRNSSEFYFKENKCSSLLGMQSGSRVVLVLIITIGIVGIILNSLPLISFLSSRKLRNGQNLLLLNVVVSDLVYIGILVPITSLHFSHNPPHITYLQATTCRIGHYVIFVSVYVSMYSMVVACLFSLMNGFCYNKPSDLIASHGLKSQSAKYLSMFSSGILCLVVWLSFLLSHAHLLFPSSNHLITSSIYQPFICNLPHQPHHRHNIHSNHYMIDDDSNDNEKVKTLWVTFLTCAFIVPFFVVFFISSFVLLSIRSNYRSYHNNYRNNHNNYNNNHHSNYNNGSFDDNHHKTGNLYESVQNKENHYKNKRDLATVVMVTAVVRLLCWLPSIIVLAISANMSERRDEMTCGSMQLLKRFELMTFCITLLCSCATPGILFGLVEDFKCWFLSCGKRQKKKKALVIRGMTLNPAVTNRSSLLRQMNEGSKMNETIMSIISDSSNHINYLG